MSSSDNGSSTPHNSPESSADIGLTGPGEAAPEWSASDVRTELHARMAADLLARLYGAITDAFARGDGKVIHFGRLPNAYNGFTALSRQANSVEQVKLRIDAAKRPN